MVGCLGPAEGHVVIVIARHPGVKHLAHTQRPLEPGQGERGAGVPHQAAMSPLTLTQPDL